MARFLISLYPRRWRERYGQEFFDFLQEHPLSIHAVVNVIGGALYQRFVALGHKRTIFSHYKHRALRAVFFAHYEANELGSNTIEPEHLLLGVLRENSDDLNSFFADSSVIQRIVRDAKDAGVKVTEKKTPSTHLRISPACKRILAYAHEEATRFEEAARLDERIGLAHILVGILREEKSHACEILSKHGLELDGAREKLVRLSKENR
jgi:ATP-dependent Clp protease ATP-binding subunit ClpC